MKKYVKLILIILALLCSTIVIYRSTKIHKYGEYNGREYIGVSENMFINAPKEEWVNLSKYNLDCFYVNLIVDNYNSLFKTWKNEYACETIWSCLNENGEPVILDVYEKKPGYDFKWSEEISTSVTEIIDGVEVSYNQPSIEDEKRLVIKLTSEEKFLRFVVYDYEHLDNIYPVLDDVWNYYFK